MYANPIQKLAVFVALNLLTLSSINAQSDSDSLIQRRIRAQQFIFVPQSATSTSANSEILSKDYKLEVTPDSVVVNLPYFGQSYTPQHGRADNEMIIFTSADFKYDAVAKKKGKWEISVIPKDSKGLRFFLTIYNNGEADMDVTNPRRETILFKGYVY